MLRDFCRRKQQQNQHFKSSDRTGGGRNWLLRRFHLNCRFFQVTQF